MEDPEVVYCEVIGPGKDAQPKPRQSQKNEASILELVAANLVRPRRIPAPRTHTVFNQPLHKMRSKLLIEITSGHENSSRYHFDNLVSGVYGAVFYDQCEYKTLCYREEI